MSLEKPKARTEAGKRRGRKRNTSAMRDASGRVRNNAADKLAREVDSLLSNPTLLRRCAVMGWEPTDANVRRARDTRLSTLHGRLYVLHLTDAAQGICEDAYLGIEAYAAIVVRYLKAIEAPRPWPKCAMLETEPVKAENSPVEAGKSIGDIETHEERVKRITGAYMVAEGVRGRMAPDWRDALCWVMNADEETSPASVPASTMLRTLLAGREFAKAFGMRA